MESLRWILLAIGVVIVVGVYAWSRQRSRDGFGSRFSREDYEEQPLSDEEDWDIRPVEKKPFREPVQEALFDEVEDAFSITADAEPLEIDPGLEAQLRGLEQVLAGDRKVDSPAASASPQVEEKIIAFYLVAPKGQPFSGSDVSHAFAKQKLQFGEMNIYHRLPDNADTPVFSIANLVEPGTFDPDKMAATSTPGLSLFMRLPGPNEPMRAFDDLANTARALASQLKGELRDNRRSLVTTQTLDSIRADVAEYERRLHIPNPS